MAKASPVPGLEFERKYWAMGKASVIGVDEVGRGCLAGPVVTAAVRLPDDLKTRADHELGWWGEVRDSKLLSPLKRKELSERINAEADVRVAWCMSDEIDEWNILRASMVAMRRSCRGLDANADAVLVDGNMNPFHPRFNTSNDVSNAYEGTRALELLIKGDQRSLSIAAASVVAKVYRDEWMARLDLDFPGYGFSAHKGYSVPAHYEALRKLGACPLHRRSFAPVREFLREA